MRYCARLLFYRSPGCHSFSALLQGGSLAVAFSPVSIVPLELAPVSRAAGTHWRGARAMRLVSPRSLLPSGHRPLGSAYRRGTGLPPLSRYALGTAVVASLRFFSAGATCSDGWSLSN